MRRRELDAALAATDPCPRERVAAVSLDGWREDLLDAVAGEPLPGAPPVRRRGWRPARLAPALILLVLVATATAFTSPGRAVTDWVGDRIGFGEPGGPPALRQFNEIWMEQEGAEIRSAHVLVVGRAPGYRQRYELITYERRLGRRGRGGRPTHCFKLDLTQERGMYTQGCGVLPKKGDMSSIGIGGNSDPDSELHFVTGRVSPVVAEVEVSFRGRHLPVELRPVPKELVRRLHLGREFSFFIAFFRGGRRGGSAEVIARGASGAVLGHARQLLPDTVPFFRYTCKRILGRPHPNPAALEDCRQVLGPRSGW